jgi:hypothetical protein
MKKVILVPLALVLGLAVGTTWAVVRHEHPEPAADELDAELAAPDSTAAAVADLMTDALDLPPGQVSEPASDPIAGDSGPAAGASEAVPGAAPSAGASPVGADDGAGQVARIFAAMQPRDAAAVLGHMSNREIEQILMGMPARQAAAVLTNLEPDRAAALSRAVLGGGVRP